MSHPPVQLCIFQISVVRGRKQSHAACCWVEMPNLSRAYELGALASAAAYFVQSMSVWGSSQLSMSLIYGVGMLILQSYPPAMPLAMRAMVVKQGIAVNPDIGRGQINAAYPLYPSNPAESHLAGNELRDGRTLTD